MTNVLGSFQCITELIKMKSLT